MTDDLAGTRTAIDHDPRNDPTYPMRRIEGDMSERGEWQQPPLQSEDVEILQSIEYKRRPAVFGTSVPPSGLSGHMRRLAFKQSESDWWHWLLLMAADRVNVVEGIVADLARGVVPNIPVEMGIRSELKHNRQAFVGDMAKMIAVTAVAALLMRRYSASARRQRSKPARPPRERAKMLSVRHRS